MKRINKRQILGLCLAAVLLLSVTVCFGVGSPGADGAAKGLYDRARLALMDRQWDRALGDLGRLTREHPDSRYYSLGLFYTGKCHEEKKMPHKARQSYLDFLKVSTNANLRGEAYLSIIDLDFELYQREKSGRKYLEEIIGFLKNEDEMVRYGAAFKLSYVGERSVAVEAVPVLKRIVETERDRELVDRAKIALMRIDPGYLKEVNAARSLEGRMLVMRARGKKTKEETFSLRIPFAFARLALESLPKREKQLLEEKGYPLDKLLSAVARVGEIISIESDDIQFKIWLE